MKGREVQSQVQVREGTFNVLTLLRVTSLSLLGVEGAQKVLCGMTGGSAELHIYDRSHR